MYTFLRIPTVGIYLQGNINQILKVAPCQPMAIELHSIESILLFSSYCEIRIFIHERILNLRVGMGIKTIKPFCVSVLFDNLLGRNELGRRKTDCKPKHHGTIKHTFRSLLYIYHSHQPGRNLHEHILFC